MRLSGYQVIRLSGYQVITSLILYDRPPNSFVEVSECWSSAGFKDVSNEIVSPCSIGKGNTPLLSIIFCTLSNLE